MNSNLCQKKTVKVPSLRIPKDKFLQKVQSSETQNLTKLTLHIDINLVIIMMRVKLIESRFNIFTV